VPGPVVPHTTARILRTFYASAGCLLRRSRLHSLPSHGTGPAVPAQGLTQACTDPPQTGLPSPAALYGRLPGARDSIPLPTPASMLCTNPPVLLDSVSSAVDPHLTGVWRDWDSIDNPLPWEDSHPGYRAWAVPTNMGLVRLVTTLAFCAFPLFVGIPLTHCLRRSTGRDCGSPLLVWHAHTHAPPARHTLPAAARWQVHAPVMANLPGLGRAGTTPPMTSPAGRTSSSAKACHFAPVYKRIPPLNLLRYHRLRAFIRATCRL